MFHFKDGWFFERNPDGSVRVLKMSDATGQAAKVSETDIDPDAWASIVSFVSAEKNASVAWSAVKEFHMQGMLRTPVAPATDLAEQIARLGNFILNEVPGEPSENEGAVDTAIRLLRVYVEVGMPLPPPLNAEPEQPAEPAPAGASEVVESPPPGAELEQPTEAPPEQPTEGEGKPPEGS